MGKRKRDRKAVAGVATPGPSGFRHSMARRHVMIRRPSAQYNARVWRPGWSPMTASSDPSAPVVFLREAHWGVLTRLTSPRHSRTAFYVLSVSEIGVTR
jgi:hypothetical protein